jgi:outer membrane protein OmpA-like peptidoglycan-associated protein
VFFEFDSSKVTPDAIEILKSVADAAKKRSDSTVMLTGYADRAGSDAYNLALSGRRAEAVKAELENMGLSSGSISSEAKGEADPLVPTADGVAEPQNRRVEIVLR